MLVSPYNKDDPKKESPPQWASPDPNKNVPTPAPQPARVSPAPQPARVRPGPQPARVSPAPQPARVRPGLVDTAIIEKPSDSYVSPNSLASTQTNKIIDQNSPLMQSARNSATEQMNARGLQNTSLNVGAGQKAVIDKAAELGALDAQPYANAAQLSQQGDLSSKLARQEYVQKRSSDEQQHVYARRLLDDKARDDRRLLEQQGSQNLRFAEFSNQFTDNQRVKNESFQNSAMEAGFEQARVNSMATMVNDQTVTLMNQIGDLLNNPDIEMSDSVIDWMESFSNSSWESAAALLGLDIEVA